MRVHSLKTKLVLQTTLIAAAGVMLVGWLIYQSLVRQELQSQRGSLAAAVDQLANAVERSRSDTLFIAKLPPIGGIMRSQASGVDPNDGSTYQHWRERLASIFSDMLEARPDYFQVRFIGLADGGREIVRVDRRDGELSVATDLQRKGERDYFLQLARAPRGFVYLSSFDLNVEHGRLEIPYRPTLRLGTPVFTASGEHFGMVVINLDLGKLLHTLAAGRPANRDFFLTNERGDFLVQPDPERTFGFARGETFRIQDELPETAAFLAATEQDSALIEGAGFGGHLIHLLRAHFDPQDTSRFVVLAEASGYGGLLSEASSVRAQVAWMTLLVALLAGVLAWLFAARIIRPLERVISAARALGEGDTDVSLDVDRPDELGELARVFSGMASQITGRERALAREKDRLRLYLRHAPSAMAVFDRDMHYQITSDRWLRDYGLEGVDVVGHGFFELSPQLPRRWTKVFVDCIDGQAVVSEEDCYQRADGQLEWLHWAIHPWYEMSGEVGGAVMFTEVITERKQAEQALQELSYQLAGAERIARVSNWIWDPEQDVFSLSEESCRIHHMAVDHGAAGHQAFLDSIHPDDRERVRLAMNALAHERKAQDMRYRLIDDETYIRTLAEPEHGEGAVAGRLLGTSQDITQQVTVEARLKDIARRLGQSNRELEEFAYVASHDLQEPLRKIQAFGDRLNSKFGDTLGEQGSDYLRRMQDSAARMSRLISDLLGYSRVTSKAQPFVPVDLNALMQEVRQDLELVIEEDGARLEVEDLPILSADATQMRQLLQNLIGNALKYHRPDVAPVVRVTSDPVPDLPDGLDADAQYLCVTVSDNGIGFDPAYADRIFQPFQRLHGRTEYKGTGIGLATCRKIVERHGGVIIADSIPGEGSRFSIVLPRNRMRYGQTDREQDDAA